MIDPSTPDVELPDGPGPVSRRRKLLFTVLLIGMLLAVFLAALDVFFYRPRLARLRQRQRPAGERLENRETVDDELIRRLGHLSSGKRSSFFNFPVAKPEGRVRVCAFGDSFTYGAEVGTDADFPSFLQRRFERRGANNVEVLNFGNGWHGFHQAYMLWAALGREYGCDYVLLGPACFQPLRDTRFNHTVQLSSPYYLHARYVLKGDDVELVEVLGKTHEERFSHYFRRFAHLRYLRYGRTAPFFLRALVPEDRVLANPFYYSARSEEEEALATYEILLAKMLQEGARVVLGHYKHGIVEIGRRLRGRGLFSTRLRRPVEFPYIAPKSHNSAWGNQL
ncbi:MAG: SGNH/GDSL hydrolase family protein, partial [bacterium]|nr:SGNH/GDSL hydrolase family protein [bacterium]